MIPNGTVSVASISDMTQSPISGEVRGEPSLGWLLAQAGHAAASGFRRALPEGMHPRHYAVLHLLGSLARADADAGTSQRVISQQLGIPQSRLVALLDDLESRGWATRAASPSDRRAHTVALTPEGVEAIRGLTSIADEYESQLTRTLTEAERESLRSALVKVLDAADTGVAQVW